MGQKRDRSNLSVSATPEVLAEIDRLVDLSAVDTSRSGVALAAIREGLPTVARRLEGQAMAAAVPGLRKIVKAAKKT